jgi:hypothetical protein
MKKIKVFLLLLSVIIFSSCLTSEFKEYRFKINPDGSGSGKIKYTNIMSQDDDGENVSFKDFDELITEWIEGTSFEDENPYLNVTDKRLFEENGVLCGEVTFTFNSIDSIGFLRIKDCACAPLMYYLGALSETFVNSNGAYLGEKTDMPFIQWDGNTKDIYFKTQVQEDTEDCRSLLALYNLWKDEQ